MTSMPPSDLPVRPGEIIAGAYRVERIIGLGGMAVVALASHIAVRHRVAIKALLPAAAGHEEVVKRFEREQRTLSKLHSEHALRVWGAGVHGNVPYMLLEYLEGTDLGELVKVGGPLPIEKAVEYLLQACHALAEAHSLGIVHRDIKPGNLFLTRRSDGSPCVKVLDFGISKVTAPDSAEEASIVTRTTAVMGSPFYMAPEQMISSREVDPRSDIWALGVTLYELLTKSLPFAASSVEGVCQRILHDEPTPLRKLRPNYPQQLEEVLRTCLRRRRADRYANIADLAQQLVPFGPEHAEHAVQAISELIRPTERPADSGIGDRFLAVGASGSDETTMRMRRGAAAGGDQTTVYLQSEGAASSPALGWTLLIAVVAFAVGVGLGWILALPTDPTQVGRGAVVASPAAAARTAESRSPRPAPPAASGRAALAPSSEPGQGPRLIDLDGEEPGG